MSQWAAHIRYYYGVDPDSLTDDQFALAWAQLYYTLDVTGQLKKK